MIQKGDNNDIKEKILHFISLKPLFHAYNTDTRSHLFNHTKSNSAYTNPDFTSILQTVEMLIFFVKKPLLLIYSITWWARSKQRRKREAFLLALQLTVKPTHIMMVAKALI